MMPAIDIRHDLNGFAARLGVYGKEKAAAAVRALNRTMTTVRAEGARDLKDDVRLPVGKIKRGMLLKRATRASMAASITFSNKRLRLFTWNPARRQTRWGTGIRTGGRLPRQILRVDAISGRVSEVSPAELKSAFIQRSRRFGTPNVWLRQGKESTPIDVLVTPSLSEVLVQSRLNEALRRRSRDRFLIVLEQEMKFRLSRRG